MGPVHSHQIRVDTSEELVTVQIGGEGSVPGGFAKVFNRVVDSQAWAKLSDAGRAAYIPLVRFADNRNQFRVQMGQAALMKYSGLSRSSIKRAIKDLLASKLIVLLEQGGVTPDGRNESNLYQLMVPVDSAPRIGGRQPVIQPDAEPHPQGAPSRTPSRFSVAPPPDPMLDRPPGRSQTGTPVARTPMGRAPSDTHLRNLSDPQDNSRSGSHQTRAHDNHQSPKTAEPADAVVLLMENGVDEPAARRLATEHPHQRIMDVVETMQFRRARGRCENPGGFIRDALVRKWATPQSVLDARAKAEARARAEATERRARQSEAQSAKSIHSQQEQVEQLI